MWCASWRELPVPDLQPSAVFEIDIIFLLSLQGENQKKENFYLAQLA